MSHFVCGVKQLLSEGPMSAGDWNEENEQNWCAERRKAVMEYLALQPQKFGDVGEWPAWHVSPYVSVWAIESIIHPGDVGWWVICGDLPTDYLSAKNVFTPREAMAAFAERWSNLADLMENGKSHHDITVGIPENAAELAPLLKARTKNIASWVQDDSLWDESPPNHVQINDNAI
jgi:hypothetical protein